MTPSRVRTALAVGSGGTMTVVAAAWLALVEVFWLPLRVAGVLVGVSVVAAVVGNLLLVGLALRLTGSRVAAALPALTWVAVVLTATVRRPEGDLVITGSGALGMVDLAFLLMGVTAAAFAVGRALGSPSRRPAIGPGSVPEPGEGTAVRRGWGAARVRAGPAARRRARRRPGAGR